jgi:hypothetical protein
MTEIRRGPRTVRRVTLRFGMKLNMNQSFKAVGVLVA